MMKIRTHISEPVFGIGLDLWVGVPFKEVKKSYPKRERLQELPDTLSINGRCIYQPSVCDYSIIWIQENQMGLPIFVHELIHLLDHQLKYRNIGFGKHSEILAYMSEYFVKQLNIFLDKKKKKKK